MNKIRLTIIIMLLISCVAASCGQVTVGSGMEPNNGTLVDLKEFERKLDNTTANRGLLLPRVNLVNLTPTIPSELATSIGSSGTWDLNAHIGLLVYNVKLCPAGGGIIYDETGPQVWSGSRWQLLSLPAIIEASPAETSGANIWGTSVVKHQAKPNPAYVAGTDPAHLANTYEEFYSADFGNAGRWMATNLTAWAYDSSSITATLDRDANASEVDENTVTRWCYPKDAVAADAQGWYANVIPGESAPLTWNSIQGLLYNWLAATGGENSYIGDQQMNANTTTPGPEEVETVAPGGKYQGICPKGWHLPSDREWTNLKNTILANPMLYASGSPATAGTAMKHPCPLLPTLTATNGLSKFIASGGFAALLTGYAYKNTVRTYGQEVNFWTSSAGPATPENLADVNALSWHVFFDKDDVFRRYNARRFDLRSLRCKKD